MSKELAKYIDHTQLKPDTTTEKIDQIIAEAEKYEFASVCVNPHWVAHCYDKLKDTTVKVCTVIGFPLGATATKTKVFRSEEHTSELQSRFDLVCRLLLEKKKK